MIDFVKTRGQTVFDVDIIDLTKLIVYELFVAIIINIHN